jgi:transposase
MLMPNYLKMPKKSQVLALLELEWSYRRIEGETGVRRETVSRYDQMRRANAAKTFPGSAPRPRFSAAVYRTAIAEKLDAGLSLQRIWQDLVEEYGYGANYESVKRYVRTLAPTRRAVGVFHCAPGAEGQVDFFRGAPTLDVGTGEWRRPWVFRLTLGHSRHGYEESRLGSEARDVPAAA